MGFEDQTGTQCWCVLVCGWPELEWREGLQNKSAVQLHHTHASCCGTHVHTRTGSCWLSNQSLEQGRSTVCINGPHLLWCVGREQGPALVARQQGVPGTRGQWVDMQPRAAARGAHHKPPGRMQAQEQVARCGCLMVSWWLRMLTSRPALL